MQLTLNVECAACGNVLHAGDHLRAKEISARLRLLGAVVPPAVRECAWIGLSEVRWLTARERIWRWDWVRACKIPDLLEIAWRALRDVDRDGAPSPGADADLSQRAR